MVNHCVLVVLVKADVGFQRISVESSASLNVFPDKGLHIVLAALSYDLRANSAPALIESNYDCLVIVYAASQFSLARLVHVTRFASDESFVYLYLAPSATKFRGVERVLHRKAQALKHEPCRFLGNAKRAMKLHAGDTVLAIAEHPESSHPLVEGERRVLKDRPNLERELFVTATAEPNPARFNEVILSRATAQTSYFAIWPAKFLGVFKATFRIGKVNDGLLQSLWRFHLGVRKTTVRQLFACVKYIFTGTTEQNVGAGVLGRVGGNVLFVEAWNGNTNIAVISRTFRATARRSLPRFPPTIAGYSPPPLEALSWKPASGETANVSVCTAQ